MRAAPADPSGGAGAAPFVGYPMGGGMRAIEITCRPVDWSAMGPLFAQWPETPVYPGSVQRLCRDCELPVWVGPRQQTALYGTGPLDRFGVGPGETIVVNIRCFRCSLLNVGADIPIVSLGNPYSRKDNPGE